MAVWNYNRGEWTEAYVFLRLLGVGRIYGADENFTKDDLAYIDIVNIIKDEPQKYLRFERFIKDEIAEIQALEGEENPIVFKVITAPELDKKASYLYNKIKEASGDRRFSVPDIELYLRDLQFNSPKATLSKKAKDLYGEKSDIILTAEDSLDHTHSIVGFSIKSHLGSGATLFNCSATSGFVFRIDGCDEAGMHQLNSLDSFMKIIQAIKHKYKLEYIGCRNDAFSQNISIVDSQMERILSTAILINSGFYDKTHSYSKLTAICNKLSEINPIGVKNPDTFYMAKLKDFLFASFAGMTASRLWNGRKKVTGGYIDVGRNGEMLYYRAISDDVFCNYLLANTHIDRPDRGYLFKLALAEAKAYLKGGQLSEEERYNLTFKKDKNGSMAKRNKKGDFGYVFYEGDEYRIVFNFQVRFQ